MTEPITSVKTYVLVWIVLILLTVATTGIAFVDLGPWNTVAALAIAVLKATFVALFFMHARYTTGITRVVMVAGLLWLGLLIAGTMDDLITRGWLGVPGR